MGYGNEAYANKLMIAEHKKQETIEHIKYILEGMYWYDRELIKLYYFGDYDGEKYTLDSLAKKTGISRTSIFHTIREARKYIKSKLDGF
jgi:DNA-directed RNA polymerase sigma subunit (sigma70/sigma32)